LPEDQKWAVIRAVIDRIEVVPGVVGKRFDPDRLRITWRAQFRS
jgi:hypothetical protein